MRIFKTAPVWQSTPQTANLCTYNSLLHCKDDGFYMKKAYNLKYLHCKMSINQWKWSQL